jgi:molybdopterin molybdotransferase
MISFDDAYGQVLNMTRDYGTETVPIKKAIGRVLAEDVLADRDFPPFNRATKDGIAIHFDAVENGRRSFEIKGVLAAGKPTIPFVEPETCIEIMTGAVVPFETDTVIMYEDVAIQDDIASLKKVPVRGQNIHGRGSDQKKGAVILCKDTRITAATMGVLATVGKSEIKVRKLPRVAVISTGNELVDIDEQPLLHQIRRSNSYALYGALSELGIIPMLLHISDDIDLLRQKLGYIVEEMDVLLISGGVSKGKFDFIPKVLEELGVEKIFHEVAQRPGKPFWFGKSRHSQTLVFSFPGNPVSTFANFYIYFKAWLFRSLQLPYPEIKVSLTGPMERNGSLTHFVGVRTQWKDCQLKATVVSGNGSGDLLNLNQIDGFVMLPSTKNHFPKGETLPFISTRMNY